VQIVVKHQVGRAETEFEAGYYQKIDDSTV